ncbi:hypothetical protein [Rugamonas aquatica]|uniref:Uncharacterized protein n=1 Tax=Rugamonas aquatica TaxID=2743357 RepID=A0A6A7N0I3_9BURK|nr:hypothetical protein [Rugamonas aquatica]MQA38517.1 hypothetical protein [Rugamonas aquatica]
MIDIKDRQGFERFWGKWKRQLSSLVTGTGGKLLCPEQGDMSFTETEDGFEVKPKYPVCFFSIPQKNSSASDKLVVFIDGTFEFRKGSQKGEAATLTSTHSNVAFFKPRADAESLKLDLIDAYHFDHFNEDPLKSAPHPVFHAQRNIRTDDTFGKFRQALKENNKNSEIIDMDQKRKNDLFGLKTFRLPTPQIDLFSLSAILAADHLTGQCQTNSKTYKSFKDFLDCISDTSVQAIQLSHQNVTRAELADHSHRFVWKWYSRH